MRILFIALAIEAFLWISGCPSTKTIANELQAMSSEIQNLTASR